MSPILSARLSSRPGGWSKGGVESIAIMRVLKTIGHGLKEDLAGALEKLPKIKVCQEVLTEGRTKGRKAFSGEEGVANLPALRERESMVTKALRRIKSFCVLFSLGRGLREDGEKKSSSSLTLSCCPWQVCNLDRI